MQYQIQQIRQHFTSIDSKFKPLPAFVIRRELFACRSQSPSFYKLRSQTVYSPLNLSYSASRPSTYQVQVTPQKETTPPKLTKIHSTHQKIMSQSSERFYQRKKEVNSNKKERENKGQSALKKDGYQSERQHSKCNKKADLISTTPFNKLNMAKVNQKSSPKMSSNRYAESNNEGNQTDRKEEENGIPPLSEEAKIIIDQYQQADQSEELKELPMVSYPEEQQSGFKLHACDPQNSYKQIMARKSGNKRSTKKSPTKTPKSPKKQHIIYYNQIYLYKPRQQNKLNTTKQSYYSNNKISPRKQSKLVSCILTTPPKRNTCPPLFSNDEEVEVINLAPEFSKLI